MPLRGASPPWVRPRAGASRRSLDGPPAAPPRLARHSERAAGVGARKPRLPPRSGCGTRLRSGVACPCARGRNRFSVGPASPPACLHPNVSMLIFLFHGHGVRHRRLQDSCRSPWPRAWARSRGWLVRSTTRFSLMSCEQLVRLRGVTCTYLAIALAPSPSAAARATLSGPPPSRCANRVRGRSGVARELAQFMAHYVLRMYTGMNLLLLWTASVRSTNSGRSWTCGPRLHDPALVDWIHRPRVSSTASTTYGPFLTERLIGSSFPP